MARLGLHNEKLGPEQLEAFWQALKEAFPAVANLDGMLLLELGLNRQTIITTGGLDEIVLDLLVQAEAKGWTKELLLAARRKAPDNPELIDFASQFGLVPRIYQQEAGMPVSPDALDAKVLQKFVVESNGMKEIVPWLERLEKLVAQVCRIEIPANAPSTFGTGFLLGSSVVLTNNHVIQDVQAGLVQPADVVLRFDYKQMSDGAAVSPGTEFYLADEWLIDSSLMSPHDLAGEEPGAEELDYALLRVAGKPGDEVLLSAPGKTIKRGWIGLPPVPPDLQKHAALFILQHPRGQALKLALDTDAITDVVKVNGTPVRLRYRTNTDEGSSGSPCFDDNWNLVGLHHLGDPAYRPDNKPLFNQAIPIPAIRELLRKHNAYGEVGK